MNRIHREEMIRFAESPEGTNCWYKEANNGTEWFITCEPSWLKRNIYIVDDVHAPYRKLQIDKPATKFMWRAKGTKEWFYANDTSWRLDFEYKVAEWYDDAIGKLCIFAGNENCLNIDSGLIQKFVSYNGSIYRSQDNQRWKYCRLLTKEDLDD